MTVEAEVTLSLTLTEQEYNLILLFRKLDDEKKQKVMAFIRTLGQPIQGTPMADFLRSIDELRGSMTPDEIREFTQALDPEKRD